MQYADVQRGFDPYRFGFLSSRHVGQICLEGLGVGDRLKGPGGTNEYSFVTPQPPLKYTKGNLAKSWEVSPDGLTFTIHLREGIRWQNKPPVNGRELVASDVKYCFDRMCGIGSGFTKPSAYNYAGLTCLKEVTAPDKYTVVFKCSAFDFAFLTTIMTDYGKEIYPPECISLPGGLDDWRNVVGTGPFILTDYVPTSSLTFRRNPDYWGYDEFHPENRLPYFDEFRSLVVPDVSTKLAAMRTGRADTYGYDYPEWRVEEQIQKTNPQMQFSTYDPGGGTCLYIQHNVKPFDDLRVRKALQMSLDINAIREIIGPGGRSAPYVSVLNKGFGSELYTPFEELPKSIQEILTYNPEKAKKLLTEAGYPNGFKMEISLGAASRNVEPVQIVADYFGRIGIQVDVQVKEPTVLATLWFSGTFGQTLAEAMGAVTPRTYFPMLFGSAKRMQHSDQYGEDLWAKASSTVDETEQNKLFKDLVPYILEKCYYIQPPVEYMYACWQPWLKNYHGEFCVGYGSRYRHALFIWIDQDLKQKMTGTR